MSIKAGLAALGVVALLVSGCGTGSAQDSEKPGSSASASADHDHDHMSGMDMSETGEDDGPSETARMVCEEDEIRDAVRRAFQMRADPTSSHSWRQSSRVYTCRWAVPHGTLLMTVQDAVDESKGRSYYDQLRRRLEEPKPIRGMENFGFPALQTSRGDVVFLKDGKTLHVDSTRLPGSSLPAGFSRSDVAYAVAAAVIACWTE